MGLRPLFFDLCDELAAERGWAVAAIELWPGQESLPLESRLEGVGGLDDARFMEDAREAAALLERMVDVAPWYELEVQLALARVALRLSDVNDARARLAAARRLADRVPEATAVRQCLDATELDLESAIGARARVPASLTTAELRVLHFLPTHLSFREIAERTFVSANTVKTQANAVYRKLDVRSRSEAVTCARELGLLDA
jgi:LuxR family maltose regulon positive regulatory protein